MRRDNASSLAAVSLLACALSGFAVVGFCLAAVDVIWEGKVIGALPGWMWWVLLLVGIGLGVGVGLLAGGFRKDIAWRLGLVTAPLFVGWLRVVTYVPRTGRDVLYDQTLWFHVLILGLAISAALATEDPWVRRLVGSVWRWPMGADSKTDWWSGISWWKVLLAPALVMTGLLAGLSILRFQHFNAGTLDLGMYDQLHWSMIHFRWFHTTLFEHPWGAQLSRFDYDYNAEHFMPIILLTTAIYWFHQSPVTLLLIQATFVGAAAFPLYFFTLRVTRKPVLALLVAMGWLLHALVHQAVLNDFHPDTLVGLFLFLALLGYESKRAWLYALGLVGVMACKEDMALLTLAMGVFLLLIHPARWRWGIATVIAGAVWFWGIATPVMQAAVAGVEDVVTIRHLDRYKPLIPEGADPPKSLGGLAWMALSNPGLVFAALMEMPRQSGLAKLLVPVGLLCVVRPQAVVLLAPAIGAHFFSAWSMQARFEIYHAAAVLPWVYVTAVYGIEWLIRERPPGAWGWLESWRARCTPRSVGVLLAVTISLSYVAASPLPMGWKWEPLRFGKSAMHEATVELLERVPPDVRVAMTSALGPHLAQRPYIFHLPDLPPDAEYVAIDVNVGTFPLPRQSLQDLAWDWIEAEGEEGSEWELVWMHEDQHHYLFKRPDGHVVDPTRSRRLEVHWD